MTMEEATCSKADLCQSFEGRRMGKRSRQQVQGDDEDGVVACSPEEQEHTSALAYRGSEHPKRHTKARKKTAEAKGRAGRKAATSSTMSELSDHISIEVSVLVEEQILVSGATLYLNVSNHEDQLPLIPKKKYGAYRELTCASHAKPGHPLLYAFRITPPSQCSQGLELDRRILETEILGDGLFDNITTVTFQANGSLQQTAQNFRHPATDFQLARADHSLLHCDVKGLLTARFEMCTEALKNQLRSSLSSSKDLGETVQRLLNAIDCMAKISVGSQGTFKRVDIVDITKAVKAWGCKRFCQAQHDSLSTNAQKMGEHASLVRNFVVLTAFGHLSLRATTTTLFQTTVQRFAKLWRLQERFPASIKEKLMTAVMNVVKDAMKSGDRDWMRHCDSLPLHGSEWQASLTMFSKTVKPFDFKLGIAAAAEHGVSADNLLWLLCWGPSLICILSAGEELSFHPHDMVGGVICVLARAFSCRSKTQDTVLQTWVDACAVAEPTTASANEFFHLLQTIDFDHAPIWILVNILRTALNICKHFGDASPLQSGVEGCLGVLSMWSASDLKTKSRAKAESAVAKAWRPLLSVASEIQEFSGNERWNQVGELFRAWLDQISDGQEHALLDVCLQLLGGRTGKAKLLPAMMFKVVNERLVQVVIGSQKRQLNNAGRQAALMGAVSAMVEQSGSKMLTATCDLVRNLLTCSMWKGFLESPQLCEFLFDDSKREAQRMRHLIDQVAQQLSDRRVTLAVVEEMENRQEQVALIFGQDGVDALRSILKTVLEFRARRKLVSDILNLCRLVQPNALQDLEEECAKDVLSLKVCHMEKMFTLPTHHRNLLERLQFARHSAVFMRMWVDNADDAERRADTLRKAVHVCLLPVFRKVQELVNHLREKTASIRSALSLFGHYKPAAVLQELHVLAAIASKHSSRASPPAWCDECATAIQTAMTLRHAAEAGSALLSMTDALGLRLGRYKQYRWLLQWRAAAVALMENKTLQSLEAAPERLNAQLQLSEEQIQSLQALGDSPLLVKWLQKGGSPAEFGRRVRILAGCVETPQDMARISAVDTIHSRVYALIKLSSTSRMPRARFRNGIVQNMMTKRMQGRLYDKFINAARQLDASGNLSAQIAQCSSDLEWFQKLESEAEQGAFADSINRMDRIMTHGIVRFERSGGELSLQVTLSNASDDSKPLSLQDLIELRAWVSLLLSADDKSNLMTLQQLGRLTTVAERCLNAMQRLTTDGSPAHATYCKDCFSLEEAEELCQELEESVKAWTKFVREQRAQYTVINRFSMKQLGVIALSPLFEFEPENQQQHNGQESTARDHVASDDVLELLCFVDDELVASDLQTHRRVISGCSRDEWLAGDGWICDVETLLRELHGQRAASVASAISPQASHAVSVVVMSADHIMENVLSAVTQKFVSPRNVFLCSRDVVVEHLLLFVRRALCSCRQRDDGGNRKMPSEDSHSDDSRLNAEEANNAPCSDEAVFLVAGAHLLKHVAQTALADEIQAMVRGGRSGASQLVVTCAPSFSVTRLTTHPLVRQDASTTWQKNDQESRHGFAGPNITIFQGPAQCGKTFQIRKFAPPDAKLITVVVHSSCMSALCESLRDATTAARSTGFDGRIAYHIEISTTFVGDLDSVAFGLIVAGSLQSSSGRVWYRRAQDLVLMEVPDDTSTLSLSSLVVRQHGIEARPKTPSELCEYIEGLESDRYDPVALHKETIGTDAETGLFHLDPEVWSSPEFQEAAQMILLSSLDVIHDQDPVLGMGGVVGLSAFCDDIEGLPADCCLRLLVDQMRKQGLNCDSWGAFDTFWRFVASQARSFLSSAFLSTSLADDLPGFRQFVWERSLALCQEFSTNMRPDSEGNRFNQLESFNAGRRWTSQHFSYVIAHQNFISFFNLRIAPRGQKPSGRGVVALEAELYGALRSNNADMDPDYSRRSRSHLLCDLSGVLGLTYGGEPADPDPHYHLSVDSITKMMATWLRLQAGIPVIIQGETGCGKTSLLTFLAKFVGVQIKVCRVHGGTTPSDVRAAVSSAEAMSRKRRMKGRLGCLLFFDEINCGPDMGRFKELLCDRRLDGRRIDDRVLLAAACNPYRKLRDKVIQRQQATGLGFRRSDAETLLGIPLRHLAYRVHALPASLVAFVWDYGELAPAHEQAYVEATLQQQGGLSHGEDCYLHGFSEAIVLAHAFLRFLVNEGEEFGGVASMRDYKERAIPVFSFFVDFFRRKSVRRDVRRMLPGADTQTSFMHRWPAVLNAMFVALYVAYEVRLTSKRHREIFRTAVAGPLAELTAAETTESMALEMAKSVEQLQTLMTQDLPLAKGIAMNAVLRENIFLMAVCAQLSIPLFVVGKPGTSKSLAKTVIADTMKGARSQARLFRHFKHVTLFSYQCSPHSTSEDVQRVFARAEQFLEDKDSSAFASVVVLDEVGLAEDSPRMPLKVLHPLLEKPKVAFFGLSNWAIDPAKMNRCVSLARLDPDCDDLLQTARGIALEHPQISRMLQPACKAFLEVLARFQPKDNFYGLRDLFSLIRMLADTSSMQDVSISESELESCVRTCFGGSDQTDSIAQCFHSHMASMLTSGGGSKVAKTPLAVMSARLEPKQLTGRFLMIQTENADAALHSLLDRKLLDAKLVEVLTGSKFPLDNGIDEVCAQLRTVRMCMAAGRTLVCCDIENCLEALYDLLNQFYTSSLGKKWVDIGLGSDRMQCEVGDGFRIILFACAAQVASFPVPLLHRLEKHVLRSVDFLSASQKQKLHRLKAQLESVATPVSGREEELKLSGLLPGFCDDTLPSLVASAECAARDQSREVTSLLDTTLWACCPEALASGSMTPSVTTAYFQEQQHSGLAAYLSRLEEKQTGGMRGLVTTFSSNVTEIEAEAAVFTAARDAEQGLMVVSVRCLDNFQRISEFDSYLAEQSDPPDHDAGHCRLVLLHASVTKHSADLVHQVLNILMVRLRRTGASNNFHFVLMVCLQRSAGMDAELALLFDREWHRAHLDVVARSRPRSLVWDAWNRPSLYKLFNTSDVEDECPAVSISDVIERVIPEALGRLRCAEQDTSFQPLACVRAVKRLFLDADDTATVLVKRILSLVSELGGQGEWSGKRWILNAARNTQLLCKCGSFDGALLHQVEHVASLQLSALLGEIASDGGLDILSEILKSESCSDGTVKKRVWTEIVRVDKGSTAILPVKHMQSDNPVQVGSHGQGSNGFCARFPLSFALHRTIEASKQSMGATLFRTVATSRFFRVLDSECPLNTALDYVHDLCRMVYRPASPATEEDEFRVITALLVAEVVESAEDHQGRASGLVLQAHICIAALSPMLWNLRKLFHTLPIAAAEVRKEVDTQEKRPALSRLDVVRNIVHVALSETTLESELFESNSASMWADTVTDLTSVMKVMIAELHSEAEQRLRCEQEWLQREISALFVDIVHVDGESPTVFDFWNQVVAGSTFCEKTDLRRLLKFWRQRKDNKRLESFVLRVIQVLHCRQQLPHALHRLITEVLTGNHRFLVPCFGRHKSKETGRHILITRYATLCLLRPLIASCLTPHGTAPQEAMPALENIVSSGRADGDVMVGRMVVTLAEEVLHETSDQVLLTTLDWTRDAAECWVECDELTVATMLMVAVIRVMLQRAASTLTDLSLSEENNLTDTALALCTDTAEDSPFVLLHQRCRQFLPRCVITRYGRRFVTKLALDPRCKWVTDHVSCQPRARRLNAFAVHGEAFDSALEMVRSSKILPPTFSFAMFSLAVAHVTALQFSSPESTAMKSCDREAVDLAARARQAGRQSKPTKQFLMAMAANRLGGVEAGVHRSILTVSKNQTDEEVLLHSFVVHAAIAVLASDDEANTLQQLLTAPRKMLSHCAPAAGVHAADTFKSKEDTWLQCENGHPVPATKDVDDLTCDRERSPQYGSEIAAEQSTADILLGDDLRATIRSLDRQNKSLEFCAVRKLTASAAGVVTVLIHALFLVGTALGDHNSDYVLAQQLGVCTSSNQTEKQALLSVLSQVLIIEVAALSRSLHLSHEDTLLVMHAVCRGQLEVGSLPTGRAPEWRTKDERNLWEDSFDFVIGPVLDNIFEILHQARVDAGMLDKSGKLEGALQARNGDVLWGERPVMSVEFCLRRLSATSTAQKQFQCLQQAFQSRSQLCLVAALPLILGMQEALLERFSGRISLEEARSTTIKSVLSSMEEDTRAARGFEAFVWVGIV